MSEDFNQNTDTSDYTKPADYLPPQQDSYSQPQQGGYDYGGSQPQQSGYDYGSSQPQQSGYDYGGSQSQQSSTGYDYGQPSGRTYQQNYSQQIYPQMPPMKSDGEGFGIASLVLGILSVLLFCTCINYLLALLAIIFGIVQIVKSSRKGMAVAGIITACISIILGILMWVGMFSFTGGLMDYFQNNSYNVEDYDVLEQYLNEL